MLRRAWGSVCRYLKQTDTMLMVLSLLICACGLVLIFSGCQSVKKVNPQRLILIQCIGIAAGFVGMIIGVPLFAVIYDIIKKLVIHGLKRNEELEMVTTYHDHFGDPEDE